MLPVHCPAQNYAWGRPSSISEVAKLAKANGNTIDESKPFAELWMGTHPSGPAKIVGSDSTLQAWLQANPQALGDAVRKRFGDDLPFLFKVLSVQTALSIQSHPDKKLAERLHAANPSAYKDDNHKPEMALALEEFEALSSFVSPAELKQALREQPELAAVVGPEATSAFLAAEAPQETKQALRAAFTSLMTADASLVATSIQALVARLSAAQAQRSLSPKESLVLRLDTQYPQDVGVLSAFFLNLVSLRAGQAIYLAANEPHAYVSGELVEVMASSDNVIRAGLTPKFRDTEVLCASLTYSQGLPEVLNGQPIHDHVKVYRPPFDEFEVQCISIPPGETVEVPVNQGPLLLLVGQGSGHGVAQVPSTLAGDATLLSEAPLARGSIVFVAAQTSLTFSADRSQELTIWAAAVNDRVLSAPAPALVLVPAAAEPVLVAA